MSSWQVTLVHSQRHDSRFWHCPELGIRPQCNMTGRVTFQAETKEKAMAMMWRTVNDRGLVVHRFDLKPVEQPKGG